MTPLKQNVRCFAGRCPGCGLTLWKWTKRSSSMNGVPGILLRCSECADESGSTDTTYARPVKSHTIRQDPEWVVDSEQVDEWFQHNMVDFDTPGTGTDALAAVEGGEQSAN